MSRSPMLRELGGFLARYREALEAGRDRLEPGVRAGLARERARLAARYPLDELLAGGLVDPEAEELRAELADYLVSEEGRGAGPEREALGAAVRARVLDEVVLPVLGGAGASGAGRAWLGWGLAGALWIGVFGALLGLGPVPVRGPGPGWLEAVVPPAVRIEAAARPVRRAAPRTAAGGSVGSAPVAAALPPEPVRSGGAVELILGTERSMVDPGAGPEAGSTADEFEEF